MKPADLRALLEKATVPEATEAVMDRAHLLIELWVAAVQHEHTCNDRWAEDMLATLEKLDES